MRSRSDKVFLPGVDGGTESLRAEVFDLQGSALVELVPLLSEREIPFIARGALARGLLSGNYDIHSKFEPEGRRLRFRHFQEGEIGGTGAANTSWSELSINLLYPT